MSKLQKSLVAGAAIACIAGAGGLGDSSHAASAAGTTSASAPVSASAAMSSLKEAMAAVHANPKLKSTQCQKLSQLYSYYQPALMLKDKRAVLVSVAGKARFARQTNYGAVANARALTRQDFAAIGITEGAISKSLQRAGIPLYKGRRDKVPSDVAIFALGGIEVSINNTGPEYFVSYDVFDDDRGPIVETQPYYRRDAGKLKGEQTARLISCWKLAQNPSFVHELKAAAAILKDIPYVGLKYITLEFPNKNQHWPDPKFVAALHQQLADAGLQVIEPQAGAGANMTGLGTLRLDLKVVPDYPKRRENGRLVISKERPRGYHCLYNYSFARSEPNYEFSSGYGGDVFAAMRLDSIDQASKMVQDVVGDIIRSSKRAKFI